MDNQTKYIIKPEFHSFKPDIADIIGFCFMIPFSLSGTIIVLLLPIIWVSNHFGFQINPQNISCFYLVSLVNVVFIACAHTLSEHILLDYNIDYKHRKNNQVSHVKRVTLAASLFGGISSRFITSLLYLVILIVSHLIDLKIISIDNDFLSQLIQINKYSFIVLAAVDKLLFEYKDTKSHWKYKIKRWLELFYMYRLKIMQKETLERIDELCSKKRYKDLFYEFGYVIDAITGGVDYDKFLEISDSFCDKKLFCKYYVALCNNCLIIPETNESLDLFIGYIINHVPNDIKEMINISSFSKKSLSESIDNMDKLLRQYGFKLTIINDKTNNNIIVGIVEKENQEIII